MSPDQFPVIIDWPVHWGDQDLFGHVNNVVYFRWLESARVAYLDRIGLARLHGQEVLGPILAAIACNFRRQIEFPDTVRIGARVTHIGNTSMTIEHAIWSSARSGEHTADATSTVVIFDYPSQRPVRVPDGIRRKIEALEGKPF
ncbi:MAG: acyl-CoA thioesterase [Pirellulales bacterium]|nr:acyl-CoA thioesterase [Pirellulales bacterium]